MNLNQNQGNTLNSEGNDLEKRINEVNGIMESTFRSIDDLILVVDLQGIFRYIFHPSHPYLLLPADQFIGKSYKEVLPGFIPVQLEAAMQQALRTGVGQTFEYPLPAGTSVLWFNGKVFLRKNLEGTPDGFTLVVREITARKVNEQLVETESKLIFDLSRAENLDEVSRLCLEAVLKMPGIEGVLLYEYQKSDQCLRLMDARGIDPDAASAVREFQSDSYVGHLMRKGMPAYLNERTLQGFNSEIFASEAVMSAALIPVIHNNSLVATLHVLSRTHPTIPAPIRRIMDKISTYLGYSIMHARQEEALRRSQQDLQGLFDTILDLLIIADEDGNIVHVNQVVSDRLGFTREELVGKSVFFLHDAQEARNISDHLVRFREGKSEAIVSIALKTRNGNLIPVETIVHKRDWMGRPALVGISRDITERLSNEEKLREQSMQMERGLLQQTILSEIALELNSIEDFDNRINNTLRKIGVHTNISRVYIFEDNPDGTSTTNTFEWCNKGIEPQIEFLQDVPYEVMPSLKPILDREGRLYSENIIELPKDIYEVLEPQDIKAIVFYSLVVKGRFFGFVGFDDCEGTRKWSLSELELLRTVSGIIANAYERKAMERFVLDERDKAQQANMAKTEFLANMSHEIRTPLNAVLGFSEALFAKLEKEENRKMVKSVISSANLLLSLLNDILDLSKIEADKMEMVYRLTDFGSLIDEIELMFLDKAISKGLSLTTSRSPDFPPSLNLDEIRIKQVVFNLVGNAVKFTNEGFVKVAAEFTPTGEQAGTLTIRVSDSGIGIPADQHEVIFNAFSQYYPGKMRHPGGTGLGLSISRRLVEKMKGTISLESQEGKGSTFTVTIPGVATEGDYKTPVKIPEASDRLIFENSTLMVVDDIVSNIEVVENHMSGIGVNVVGAESAAEALELLKRTLPEAILVDIRMPGMGGIAFAQVLKEDKTLRHIPLIAFTAYSLDDESEETALFENILYKPVRRADLIQVVTQTLKSSKVAGIKAGSTEQARVVLLLHDKGLKRMVDFCCTGEKGKIVTLGSMTEMQKYFEFHEADRLVIDLDFPGTDSDTAFAFLKDPARKKGQRIALVNKPGDPRPETGFFDAFLVKPLTILDVYQLWSETSPTAPGEKTMPGVVPELRRVLPPPIAGEKQRLVRLIEEDVLPKAESLRQFRSTQRISALCEELEKMGRQFEQHYLVRFAESLLSASRTYQVDQTGYLLDILPDILKGIIIGIQRSITSPESDFMQIK